jgi:non-specific serine/threonine protein kinase
VPYVHTVQRLAAALGLAPGERAALIEAGRRQGNTSARLASLSAATNIVGGITSFIGREQEVVDVSHLLATTRLLTLTGPGGVGKTRLALQVASVQHDEFADGIWFVDLAPLGQPELVAQTVAFTMGLRAEPGQSSLPVLTHALGLRRALIILDNCEHLIEACARLAEQLVRSCPNLVVLATSREPLSIPGERNWRLPPLPVADPKNLPPLETLRQYEAIRLFVERATDSDPDFVLTNANALAVAQICARLDGIPLALELAAARISVLAPEQIAKRLNNQFGLLTHGSRTAVPRQRTLRALVDWSHDLLTAREQALFRRLSAFPAGCTLDAAETVCVGDGIESQDVLDLLTQLIEKSLVMVDTRGDERRYRLLATLRQYGQEKLAASGEASSIEHAQARYYVRLVDAVSFLHGRHWDRDWADRIECDYDNIRAVLARCYAQGDPHLVGLKLIGALLLFWWGRDYWVEGEDWGNAFLNLPGPLAAVPEREIARIATATLAMFRGRRDAAEAVFEDSRARCIDLDFPEGVVLADAELVMIAFFRTAWRQCATLASEALPLAERVGSPWTLAILKCVGGFSRANLGQLSEGGKLIEESARIARKTGEPSAIAAVLGYQASFAMLVNDETLCAELLREGADLAREVGHLGNLAGYLTRLADLEVQHGNIPAAATLAREAIPYYQRLGSHQVTSALVVVAGIALGQGQIERAAKLLATVDAFHAATGTHLHPTARAGYQRCLERVKALLPGDVLTSVWCEGRDIEIDDVLGAVVAAEDDLTLHTAASSRPATEAPEPSSLDGLTGREREVCALVARGLSNRDIAQELVITQATVEVHVKHILNKLGYRSRLQIAVWFSESQLASLR